MGTSKQLGQSEEDDVYEPVLMTGKQLESRWVVHQTNRAELGATLPISEVPLYSDA